MIENKTLTPFQEFVSLASKPFVPADVADTLITRYINAPAWERPLVHQEAQNRVAGLQRRNDWQEAVKRANENERASQQNITSQTDPAVFRKLRVGLEELDLINQRVLRQQRRMIGEQTDNSLTTEPSLIDHQKPLQWIKQKHRVEKVSRRPLPLRNGHVIAG